MDQLGKFFVSIGIALLIFGLLMIIGQKFGLGKLPGDIFIQKGNFTFFFPIVSSIIISIILTIILNIFKK